MQRYHGLYRAAVSSNKDPLNQRRLKLVIPVVLGKEPTNWAWPVDPAGVTLRPPKVGQGVWVMFENGDPSFPVWLGVFGKPAVNQVDIVALNAQVVALTARVTSLESRVTSLEQQF